MTTRRFLAAFLVVALLVAGVASFYASGDPDGLERVAEQAGFSEEAEDSPTAGSPLADYSTTGVDDERLSVGLSGVVGALSVLVLAGGLFWVLRRRGDASTQGDEGGLSDTCGPSTGTPTSAPTSAPTTTRGA